MEVKISYNKPIDLDIWNTLCKSNGNLLYSTFYDEIQAIYHQEPVYLHIYNQTKLVAGVKLYYWESRKIPFITPPLSRKISQFGEFVIDNEYKNKKELIQFINQEIKKFILLKKGTVFTSGGFYGNENLISNPFNNHKKTHFNVSVININKSEEDLMKSFHPKHRNKVRLGLKSNLTFEENTDIEVLIDLIQETYGNQGLTGTSPEYIRRVYETLIKSDNCRVFAVKKDNEYLAATLIQIYGGTADYTFSGMKNNKVAAGQFLQWNIINLLKEQGITLYSFGQTASEEDKNNIKFSEGITSFKTRFGTENLPCFKQETILRPLNYKLWNIMLRSLQWMTKK